MEIGLRNEIIISDKRTMNVNRCIRIHLPEYEISKTYTIKLNLILLNNVKFWLPLM